MPLKRRHISRFLFILFLLIGSINLGQGMYIKAKALFAQVLLSKSWTQTLATHHPVKPWPWADTWPVARMLVPQHGIDQIILAGDNGRTLAFGPGVRLNTPLPGVIGNSIISAHRDTHFEFLQNVQIGEEIIILDTNNTMSKFRVISLSIMHMKKAFLPNSDTLSLMTLVTCYPFNAISANSEYRFVVIAQKEEMALI